MGSSSKHIGTTPRLIGFTRYLITSYKGWLPIWIEGLEGGAGLGSVTIMPYTLARCSEMEMYYFGTYYFPQAETESYSLSSFGLYDYQDNSKHC